MASSIRATRRRPSCSVASACQTPEPTVLISITPWASPEAASVTTTDTRVGSAVEGGSKPRCGGSGSYRRVTGAEAAASVSFPAASRLHSDNVHSPGAGTCMLILEMSAAACSPLEQLAVPAAHSLYLAAAIGARSGSEGLIHAATKSLRFRQASPPSTATSARPGGVLSIREVSVGDFPTLP